MPAEKHEKQIKELLGQSFDANEVPSYPGRMYWVNDGFATTYPHAPMRYGEIRLREAWATEDGDFTIYQARAIDSSNPEDSHSEWFHYVPPSMEDGG